MPSTRTSTRRKYRQAAFGYLVYGILYLAGAVYLARTGVSARAVGAGSVWWFLLGGLMVVILPVLIGKQFKWLTRALAVLVFVRVAALVRMLAENDWYPVPMPWGGSISALYGALVFLGVSVAAGVLLARAGWAEWLEKQRAA